MKLREMDKHIRKNNLKFSKAFSEFTCLIYANISELSSSRQNLLKVSLIFHKLP